MPTIRIDDEVWRELQRRARAFVDTPNDVIRRLLQLEKPQSGGANGVRAPRGEITSDKDYYQPILEVLEGLGGRGQVKMVLDAVERNMAETLKPADYAALKDGSVRWRTSAQFARNDMVHRLAPPLLSPTSPRGWWEITPAGREYLKQAKHAAR